MHCEQSEQWATKSRLKRAEVNYARNFLGSIGGSGGRRAGLGSEPTSAPPLCRRCRSAPFASIVESAEEVLLPPPVPLAAGAEPEAAADARTSSRSRPCSRSIARAPARFSGVMLVCTTCCCDCEDNAEGTLFDCNKATEWPAGGGVDEPFCFGRCSDLTQILFEYIILYVYYRINLLYETLKYSTLSSGFMTPTWGWLLNILLKLFSLFTSSSWKNFFSSYKGSIECN